MDRMRMTMTSLLIGATVLGAGAACAQGHDPSAAVQRLRAQLRESPEARARQLAEKHAWLRRLVGQFHGESIDSRMRSQTQQFLVTSIDSSETTETRTQLYYSLGAKKQGRAECVALDTEVGVSCLLDLKTQQGEGSMSAFRVMLPLLPPEADIPETHGSLQLGLVESTTMEWVALEGNTATFKVDCSKVPSRTRRRSRSYLCGQQVRITARPDGTRVKVSIESGTSRSTLMDLNRGRNSNAAEGAGLRSGQ
jgi:hypothetical protein